MNIGVLIWLVGILLVQTIPGNFGEEDAEETEVEEPERTCKKYINNLVQGFLTGALNCLAGKFQMRNVFEIGTRFYCLFKCVLQDVGVLGADGKLDEVSAIFYFQEAIPEIILDVVILDAQPCLEMAAAFEPSQYYCQSYSPFVQCVFNSLVRTLGPYALNCYATPNLAGFFGLINAIVPQATPATSSNAVEIKRRYTEATLRYNRIRNHKNSTLNTASNAILTETIPSFKPMPN